MRRRNRFRPSALGQLEDRITLSHASVAEMTPQAQLVNAVFRGRALTTSSGAAGSTQDTTLSGGAVRRDGVYRVVGALSENGSLAPPFSGLNGTITLISVSRRFPGVAIEEVEGPVAKLAPSTRTSTPIRFQVTRATGVFAQFLGADGTGILTLQTRPRRGSNVSFGRFTLTVTVNPQ